MKNLTTQEIQQILDAQRKQSKLHQLGDSQIKRTQSLRDISTNPEWRAKMQEGIANRTDEWRENVRNANKTKTVRRKTEAYYASREKLKSDPAYQAMMAERNKEMAKDPAWRAAHLKSREGMANPNSEWRQKIAEANRAKGQARTIEGSEERERFMASRERMKADPTWRKNVVRARGKPFVTPLGVFDTLANAGDAYNIERNFRNGKKWVYEQLKKGTEGFYHVTWDEYDELTK
jgi:hypothetical protein